VFGIGFGELVLVGIVLLVVLGPKELPRFLRGVGQGVAKLRQLSVDLRRQSGIDEIIREEGLAEDLEALRSLSRGRVVDTFIESAMRPDERDTPAMRLGREPTAPAQAAATSDGPGCPADPGAAEAPAGAPAVTAASGAAEAERPVQVTAGPGSAAAAVDQADRPGRDGEVGA
jgi:sec-independent protein translocase protein TatB